METYKLSKNANKLFFITLFVVFAFALSSCGGGSKMSKSDKSEESNQVEVSGLTSNHGLQTGEFSVEPGASEERGNVEVSCPADGSACVVTVAEDGSVVYDKTGGMPTFMSALAALMAPLGHGLSAGEFSVEPGASEERGNVGVSCPSGDNACTVTVTDDGSMNYSATGGIPTIMLVRAPLDLPSNHDLSSGEFTVEAGMTEAHGNVEVSCPSGDTACTVTVTADGMAVYGLSGSMPTFALLPVRQVRPGLSKSLNEPVYSNDANDIPFDQLISNSNNVFAPISTAFDRISGDPSTATSSDTAIKAISGDGDGGYYVTFVIDGEEWTQHYTKEHYNPAEDDFASKSEDGAPFHNIMWFERTRFTYFNVFGGVSGSLDPNIRPRFYFIAGVKTENLPNGTAEYVGDMIGQIWRSDRFSDRTRVRGVGVLRADFEQSTVNGEISNIRVRPQNSDSYSSLEDNKFMIETGNISNSQFVANLIGTDSTSGSSGTQHSNEVISSIQGFDGNVLGEFYGPQANEVGAVLNATRGDAVLYGYMTYGPFNPTGPLEQANSEPIDATILRDFSEGNTSVRHTDDSTRVESIQSDGGSGIILTYLVDGDQYTVQFEDNDLVNNSTYNKVSNNRDQFLWSNTNGFSTPDFNYLNSYNFISGVLDGTQYPTSVFVNGLQTDAENLPGGEATYLGRAWIDSWTDCCVFYRERASTKGNLSLIANFGESKISGLMDNIEYRGNASSSFISVPNANAVISEGTISGNLFNANLQGTGKMDEVSGEMSGAFYGPSAEEVGGVIKTTSTTNSVGIGWFGGSREDQ